MGFRRFLACIAAVTILILPIRVFAQESADAEQTIITACAYGETVDIRHLGMNKQQIQDLFYQLYDSGKLPWYTDDTYVCTYDQNTGLALYFEPALLSPDDYDRTLYAQKAAEFLDTWVTPGMDPVSAALAIHDGLIVSCVYDETLEKNTGYDLLVNGSTVCLGYAQAYQYLLAQVGIESVIVTSETMEHAWNLVKLDDQWYHVDVTWDDPAPDSYGYVAHTYFLVTDAQISQGDDPHHDWETDIVCSDTRFTDAYWRDVFSQISFDGNTAYYVKTKDWDNYIYARDMASGNQTLLYKEEEDYLNIGHGEYSYSHGSLSLWNGRLYYNTMNALLSMSTQGGDRQVEYTYNYAGQQKFLYTCYVTAGQLYATVSGHDGDRSGEIAVLQTDGFHSHSYTMTTEAPTCTEPGVTRSVCECGLSAESDLVSPTGHSYAKTDSKLATPWGDGYRAEVCSVCGDSITTTLPQIQLTAKFYMIVAAGVVLAVGGVVVGLLTGKKKTKV